MQPLTIPNYDVVVVGTGFGGSVTAYRLAQKGYKVLMLEMGKEQTPESLRQGGEQAKHLFWMPALGMKGYFAQDLFKHMAILRGVGVGGGSLVYAAVHLRPNPPFYQDMAWRHLTTDWSAELAPYYDKAEYMLGVAENPYQAGLQDEWLAKAAQQQGTTTSSVTQAIFFGKPHELTPDPYFHGKGPDREGCRQCGRCMTGCEYGSKNSLDKNYLYFARQLGVEIRTLHQVSHIESNQGVYTLHVKNPLTSEVYAPITAAKVVLAAGVLGTLDILFASKQRYKTLPHISSCLGERVRTNSEAFVNILAPEGVDLSEGTGISSHYYPNEITHITQNRASPSWSFMRLYMGHLIDGVHPTRRAIKALWSLLFKPWVVFKMWFARDWHKRITILTVMQQADNELRLSYGPAFFKAFKLGLRSHVSKGERAPSFLQEANDAARAFATASGGVPYNMMSETVGQMAATAHILGGAVMADSETSGVVDITHEVFNYPGLYVMDGSVIPANVGVNPSLTITALAERFVDLWPEHVNGSVQKEY